MTEIIEVQPPIRGFFQGYKRFFTWALVTAKKKDPAGYQRLLKRMALSDFGASAIRVGSAVGDFGLAIAFMLRYDDWFTEHGIQLGSRRDGLGYLSMVAIFWISHAVVCYFLTLVWYLGLGDDPQPSAPGSPDQSSRSL